MLQRDTYRSLAIRSWIDRLDVKPEDQKRLDIAAPYSKGTVIIPAYNEETQILGALESATEQCQAGLDVLVVDNQSVDSTASMVKEFSRKCNSAPINIIKCEEGQGYGVTRRKAFVTAMAHYLLGNPGATKQHHLIMLDADSRLTEEYGRHHHALVESNEYDAIGVTYKFPPEIDNKIHEITGMPNYLASIAYLSSRVTADGMALIQTAAQGGAVEVGALAMIKFEDFMTHDKRESDRFIGWRVSEMGGRVGFNPAVTIHNERRFTQELALGLAMNASYGQIDPRKMRQLQSSMRPEKIDEVLATTSKADYVRFHRQRLESFIKRNIVNPIIQGQLSGERLLNHIAQQGTQINIHANDVVEQLANFFIKNDDALAKIYQ